MLHFTHNHSIIIGAKIGNGLRTVNSILHPDGFLRHVMPVALIHIITDYIAASDHNTDDINWYRKYLLKQGPEH